MTSASVDTIHARPHQHSHSDSSTEPPPSCSTPSPARCPSSNRQAASDTQTSTIAPQFAGQGYGRQGQTHWPYAPTVPRSLPASGTTSTQCRHTSDLEVWSRVSLCRTPIASSSDGHDDDDGRTDMPTAAPRICARCGQLVQKGRACPCRPAWEGSPQRIARGRAWQRFRLFRLRGNPICQWVDPDGTCCRLLSSVVDHIVPFAELTPEQIRANQYSWDATQCLCAYHHQVKTTADALRGKRRARGADNR